MPTEDDRALAFLLSIRSDRFPSLARVARMMRYSSSCHVLLVLALTACRIVVGPVGVHAGLPAVDVGVTLNDTSIASLEDLKSDLLQSFQPGAQWSQEARLLGCDVTVRTRCCCIFLLFLLRVACRPPVSQLDKAMYCNS